MGNSSGATSLQQNIWVNNYKYNLEKCWEKNVHVEKIKIIIVQNEQKRINLKL